MVFWHSLKLPISEDVGDYPVFTIIVEVPTNSVFSQIRCFHLASVVPFEIIIFSQSFYFHSYLSCRELKFSFTVLRGFLYFFSYHAEVGCGVVVLLEFGYVCPSFRHFIRKPLMSVF